MSKEFIIILIVFVLAAFITMGLWGKKDRKEDLKKLDWKVVTDFNEIDQLLALQKPVLFFKHSFRCGISSRVLRMFEAQWNLRKEQCEIVFIDVNVNRDVSDYFSRVTGIVHQSPQAILVKNKAVIYNQSHGGIHAEEIENLIAN